MKIVVGNFKMNLNKEEIDNYLNVVKEYFFPNVVFCPSTIYLDSFIKNSLTVGTQDIGFMEKGAYTGDISASMYKSIGVSYAIIGHSERRKYYRDDKYVNQKLNMALKAELKPILCIGETQEERENGLTNQVLIEQITQSLQNIDKEFLKNVIIAYEPVWSIGTGNIPTNEEIFKTIDYIKTYINYEYEVDMNVLYGGSVNQDNISILEEISNVDGYLVGGCSIDVNKFVQLINYINNRS